MDTSMIFQFPTRLRRMTCKLNPGTSCSRILQGCHADTNLNPHSVFTTDGTTVIVDSISLGLLEGSTLVYSTELIGSAFKIANNPHAQSDCGCGVSFSA